MGRRLFFTATIATAAALVLPVAALAMHVDPVASSHTPSVTVTASTPTTFLPVVGGGDTVSVRIPSIVMVRVDARGRVLAIATNSGRALRHGDLVYLYGSDGSVRPSTTFDLRQHWHGDFTRPAVFQVQSDDREDD